jgi:hypothetical protein
MKEAIDLRDTGGRDPAFYAVRSLESTIKIISGEKQLTTGKEKGAHNYIDNLRGAKLIEMWEMEALKDFFTKVRNPFGHGPGAAPMPTGRSILQSWHHHTGVLVDYDPDHRSSDVYIFFHGRCFGAARVHHMLRGSLWLHGLPAREAREEFSSV